MRRIVCLALLLLAGLASLAAAASPEKSWPWFRGLNRTAVSPETGLLQEWPKEGPPLLWETKGAGRGYASLAIADGRIYTLGDGPSTADDSDEYLTCFDLDGGKQLWKTKTGPAWNQGSPDWQGSRSTPAVDGDRVYVITPHGVLLCCQTSDGQEVWRKNLKEDFGGNKGDGWGYSESPLIDGDKLVCMPGGDKNAMVALNKLTGEKIWGAVREGDKGAGHASIVITQVGDTKVYVCTTASGGLGVRASDGKLLWTYNDPQATAVIPTPIVRGDLVLVVAGYKSGGALLRQVPEGDGVKIEEVYPLKSNLNNKHGGVVLVGDYLYGDSGDSGTPYCAEFMTGKEKWKERGAGGGSASVAAADGCLYFLFANGTMSLVKANPEKYEEVGSFKIGEVKRPAWSHPVILDGKLYIRNQDQILCYDIKAK
jgi:outer membrane protein assembly factor BamB